MKNRIAQMHQKMAHPVNHRRNAVGYSGPWINQTNTYGHQRVRKPIAASFSHDAFGMASLIGVVVVKARCPVNVKRPQGWR